MKAKQLNDVGTRRWEAEIQPVLEATKMRGFVMELVRELDRVSAPRTWMRQQVYRYLHSDPAKRIEPLAGIGMVFLDAAKRVAKKMEKERKASNG